jgi:hypothetical protein
MHFANNLGVLVCLLNIWRWIWRMVDDDPVIQAAIPVDLAVTVNITFQRLDLYYSNTIDREREPGQVKVTEVFIYPDNVRSTKMLS